MEKLLDEDLENASQIKRLLLQNGLGENFRERYNLLRQFFKCLRPRMETPEQTNGDQALLVILNELKNQEKGHKGSNFIKQSDEFENELNDFIEKKINRR